MCTLATAGAAPAQTANGSLRGTVKDEQGGALPGVSVTARSPEALTPGAAVTDATGEFRITNLGS